MKKRVTDIRELSKILDLSITTVSRVLNGKAETYRISSKTARRVIQAAKEYNYFPSKIARGLKTDKSDTLGLIIPDISNPFFSDIASSILKESRTKGFSLILCDTGGIIKDEEEMILLLQSHKVEGIIIAPVGTHFDHIIQAFNSGLPIVVIDRASPNIDLPSITSDNYQGAYNAVQYLVSMGHKRIGCIQGIPNCQVNKDRVKGYIDACEASGIPLDKRIIVGSDFSMENGYRQVRIMFGMTNPPAAVFALSNLISLGAIKAFNEMNLIIPDDVSLISFDEQPYSAFLGTPMTTVNQQKTVMGLLAVDVLIKTILNEEYRTNPISMKLKTNLIIRNSVKKQNS